jgi:tetratricopeptide (TPR) repeat protein
MDQDQSKAAPSDKSVPILPDDKAEGKTDLGRERIKGVFSTQSVEKVGTGTTVRKTIQKTFWMAEENADGIIEIQPLNVNYVPSGPKRKIEKDDLLRQFSPEPEFYVQSVYPAMRKLNQTIELGEDHRKKGRNFSAEFEFNSALNVDVENVRANFGLGLTYLERGESKKADNIFERLVKLDAAFEPEHKHLFNEFGINLRKTKMYEQAIDYYERALQLTKGDENIHYNIARAYFAKQQVEKTVKHLNTVLQMNEKHEAATQFLAWLKSKGFIMEDGSIVTNPPGWSYEAEGKPGAGSPPTRRKVEKNDEDEGTASKGPVSYKMDI